MQEVEYKDTKARRAFEQVIARIDRVELRKILTGHKSTLGWLQVHSIRRAWDKLAACFSNPEDAKIVLLANYCPE